VGEGIMDIFTILTLTVVAGLFYCAGVTTSKKFKKQHPWLCEKLKIPPYKPSYRPPSIPVPQSAPVIVSQPFVLPPPSNYRTNCEDIGRDNELSRRRKQIEVVGNAFNLTLSKGTVKVENADYIKGRAEIERLEKEVKELETLKYYVLG
jgi:hypothetical protein